MHMVVYTWWCWHICKGFERKRKVETPSSSYRACKAGFSEKTEAKQVIGSDRTLTSGVPTRPVSSSRGAHEGAERAVAGQGAPMRSVSFCRGANAADRTLAEHYSTSGHAHVAVRSEVREDRTLACIRSWCTRPVQSQNGGSRSSLLCTGRRGVVRPVWHYAASSHSLNHWCEQ
jgi:hypothetical protein